jgi:hypothetical protein
MEVLRMKKSRKVLGAIIASTLVTSAIAPSFAKASELSIDEIYANAYNATVKAIDSKIQKDVNAARTAIGMLPQEYDWAIGEFSKQVDYIQHPIFVNAYDAIVKAQASPSQAAINFAKASIDPDMPDFYRASYSQAVDIVQQKLMQDALDSLEEAVSSLAEEYVTAASSLIDEIKTAADTSIVDWAQLVKTEYTDAIAAKTDLNTAAAHSQNYTISSKALNEGAISTFGPSQGTADITGDITISISDADNAKTLKLQNMSITGNLDIDFGSGNVLLENITVNGVTVTNVGGNSLHIIGKSTVGTLTVKDKNNDAHIVVEGESTVAKTTISSGALLQTANIASDSNPFNEVLIAPATEALTASIILNGKFNNVSVDAAANIEVKADSTVQIKTTTQDKVNIKTEDNAQVLVGGSNVTTEGTGSVSKLSTYELSSNASTKAFIAGTLNAQEVDVTMKSLLVGDSGYSSVRFNVSIEKPEGAEVQLLAMDSNGTQFDVAELGYWGPENGFELPKEAEVTTKFTTSFSTDGQYEITYSLVDLKDNKVIAEKTETVEVISE